MSSTAFRSNSESLIQKRQYQPRFQPASFLSGSDYSHPRNLHSHARNPYSHPPGILIHIAPESLSTCPGIRTNPYSYESICTRSSSDRIVARHLLDALTESKKHRFDLADKSISMARSLAPEFFEVHRVEALIKCQQGLGARESYERAVELEPKSAPLRLWYANYLIRYEDDLEGALKQLSSGLALDPGAPELLIEIARVLLYKCEFDESRALIVDLLGRTQSMTEWMHRKLRDLVLTFFQRKADYYQINHNNEEALGTLEQLRKAYDDIPQGMADYKMRAKVAKALQTATRIYVHLSDEDQQSRAFEIKRWINAVMEDNVGGKGWVGRPT